MAKATAPAKKKPDAAVMAELRRARDHAAAGRMQEAEAVLAGLESRAPKALDGPDAELTTLRSEIASRLAEGHLKVGRILAAMGHLELAVRLGAPAEIRNLFLSLLPRIRFKEPRPELNAILCDAFRQGWAEPNRIGRIASPLLRLAPDFSAIAPGAPQAPDLLSPAAARILADPLLLALLDHALVVDPELERTLVALRHALLDMALGRDDAGDGPAPYLLPFAVALANQAFASEYAYPTTVQESFDLDRLAGRVRADLDDGRTPSAMDVAVVAAYRPLIETLGDVSREPLLPRTVDRLVHRQVRDGLEEARIRDSLPKLTPVRAVSSRAVKEQYEANPYPRWLGGRIDVAPRPVSAWMRATFPVKGDAPPWPTGEVVQTLIAGCGTGRETADMATMFADLEILAIDISRTSLAHAQRRATELDLHSVSFAQADILQADRIGRHFDFVISAGVLHHLKHPAQGLAALKAVTRPGGRLLLALYSRAGRRRLAAARAFARAGSYPPTRDGLRRFRQDVLLQPAGSNADWRDDLLSRDDFYSLSGLRDLLFHAQETEFDVPQLGVLLDDLQLRFAGFALPAETIQRFYARFRAAADPLSLDQWATFEAENPDTFGNMYHFLVDRP